MTVYINSATNDPPLAVNDSVSTDEDTSVKIHVLPNDSDPNGDPLTTVFGTQPYNGVTSLNADGTFDYTPNPDFAGKDSFVYTISDGNGGIDTATGEYPLAISINVLFSFFRTFSIQFHVYFSFFLQCLQ